MWLLYALSVSLVIGTSLGCIFGSLNYKDCYEGSFWGPFFACFLLISMLVFLAIGAPLDTMGLFDN